MNIQKLLNIILAAVLLFLLIKMKYSSESETPQIPKEVEMAEATDYTDIPKKNIGKHSALYPTPTTIVGTTVNGRINWLAIAHIGNVGLEGLMLSMNKSHHSNQGIKKNKTLSVNIVTESMVVPADFVGMESGKDVDKSAVFEYFEGELENAPMIKASPLTMECRVVDVYDTERHDNFVVEIVNTYASETVLDENGKVDYTKVKPLLFEMPKRSYYKVGERVGKAWKEGEKYQK